MLTRLWPRHSQLSQTQSPRINHKSTSHRVSSHHTPLIMQLLSKLVPSFIVIFQNSRPSWKASTTPSKSWCLYWIRLLIRISFIALSLSMDWREIERKLGPWRVSIRGLSQYYRKKLGNARFLTFGSRAPLFISIHPSTRELWHYA